jgi:hypothetical protein
MFLLTLSFGLSAKTYELKCKDENKTCNASSLAIPFVNEHLSYFSFNDDDLFIIYDNEVVIDSISYVEILNLKKEIAFKNNVGNEND